MILVNGAATDSVAVTDRGLAYGDGVFRTLLSRRGVPRGWPRHYRKLERDCAALAIPCPSEGVLAGELARVLDRSRDEVAKIIVTRGSGERGYALPHPASPTRIVMTAAIPAYPEHFAADGIGIHWCRTRVASQPRLAGIKHLNRLENVLARAEWNDPAMPEGLMLDGDGNVVGGTMTNLFIVENHRLLTPPLSSGGVAGVTRERVIEAAQRHGMDCREEPVSQARLLGAQEVLLVNSVIGVWCVRTCADRDWQPGTVAAHVREWLDEERD